MKDTKLIYIENPDIFEIQAKVLEVRKNLKEGFLDLVLDQTIFYVQGGGQPSDGGVIQIQDYDFKVMKVFYGEDGEVIHRVFGDISRFLGKSEFDLDSGSIMATRWSPLQVVLKVDEEKRKLHSRIHSAGHLLDLVISKFVPNLISEKGFHFVEGAYVTYKILNLDSETIQKIKTEDFKKDLEIESNRLIQKNLKMEIEVDDSKTFQGKSLRKVGFAGYPKCGCGGTHIKNSSEIRKIEIRKIKIKKDKIKVSYQIAD